VVYIGDHETDVRCARNANVELRKQRVDIQIISIGVSYGVETNPAQWNFPPDYTAATPQEILHLVERLQSPNTSA
jgi:phosphoglycolate phosphatase-like HAD superfamily hydrolase